MLGAATNLGTRGVSGCARVKYCNAQPPNER